MLYSEELQDPTSYCNIPQASNRDALRRRTLRSYEQLHHPASKQSQFSMASKCNMRVSNCNGLRTSNCNVQASNNDALRQATAITYEQATAVTCERATAMVCERATAVTREQAIVMLCNRPQCSTSNSDALQAMMIPCPRQRCLASDNDILYLRLRRLQVRRLRL